MRNGISRRGFLRGVGAGMGILALSRTFQSLQGCAAPRAAPLNGQELVTGVSSQAATVSLVAGETCQPETKFQLLYDTISRSNPADYAFVAPEVNGFQTHDAISFHLNSLGGDRRYYYRVGFLEGGQWRFREERSFHTARSPGSPFRFCITSDAHIAPRLNWSPRRDQVYQNVLADSPDLLLSLGDDTFLAFQTRRIYPWPEPEQIRDTFKTTRRYVDLVGHSVSYLPINGNHEGLYGWTTERREYQDILKAKLNYFPTPTPGSRTFSQAGDDLGRYGAFTWGDALFVWLDVVGFCEQDPLAQGNNASYLLGSQQRDFLESVLAGSNSIWKFIFAHHLFGGDDACAPGYGRGGANAAGSYDQAEIQALMEAYGAQVFFYGHDHVFSVSEANGRAYICTGNAGSGAPWAEILEPCYRPYSVFSLKDGKVPFGHVRVEVSPTQTVVSYVAATTNGGNGAVVDRFVVDA